MAISIAAELRRTQVAFFSPGFQIRDRLAFARKLLDAIGDPQDVESSILPLPADTPHEIPRIILQAKDGMSSLRVALSRADLEVAGIKAEVDASACPVLPLDVVAATAAVLSEAAGGSLARLALVTYWDAKLPTPGAGFLASAYLRDHGVPADPSAIELHVLHKVQVSAVKANRWVRVKSAHAANDPGKDNYVTVQIDINSLGEVDYRFEGAGTRDFFAGATTLTGRTMEDFFHA